MIAMQQPYFPLQRSAKKLSLCKNVGKNGGSAPRQQSSGSWCFFASGTIDKQPPPQKHAFLNIYYQKLTKTNKKQVKNDTSNALFFVNN